MGAYHECKKYYKDGEGGGNVKKIHWMDKYISDDEEHTCTYKLEILWPMLTKWYPPLPHVLYGKVLVLLWETPKSFE